MKMNNLILSLIMLISIALLSGCQKEGPAGKDGNANVKTEIIKVYGNEWGFSDPFYGVDKTSDLLTQDIIDNGSVHLYLEAGDGIWMALPYQTMGFGYAVNDLAILTEGSGVTTSTMTFKLVVIQGNMQPKSMDLDFADYNAVKEYFGLKD
jgi:hypothetical protein